MPDIGAYINVYNTALVILERKGALEFEKDREWWHARKAEWHFLADDPMQLLGLLAIYNFHSASERN